MKYLVSFLLLFCGLSAFSQADTIFVLGAEFGATTEPTDSTFTVDIVHPTDQLGQAFTASKIQVGYRLIDVLGRLYRVKSVDATGIGSSTLTVVELQDAAGPSGTGLVYRKPNNSDCIPEIQTGDIGISYALAARVANHNAVVGCGGTGGGSGTVETVVAGTGISVDDTDPDNPIVTNTGVITEVDGDITNEGILGVGAGSATSATLTTNTSTGNAVTIQGAGSVVVTEATSANGGTITLTGSTTGDNLGDHQATQQLNIPKINNTNGIRILGTLVLPNVAHSNPFNRPGGISFPVDILYSGTLVYSTTELVPTWWNGTNWRGAIGQSGPAFTDRMTKYTSDGSIAVSAIDQLSSGNGGSFGYTGATNGFLYESGYSSPVLSISAHAATGQSTYNFRRGLGNNTTPTDLGAATYGIGTLNFQARQSSSWRTRFAMEVIDVDAGTDVLADLVFKTASTNAANHTEAMRLTNAGRLGIGTSTPGYTLSLGGTQAAARFTPHDVTLTGAEGLLYADLSENTFKGHNGTSFFRFMQQSTTVPTNGQIGVFNSTTLLYEPSNPKARSYTPTSTADANGATGDIAYDDSYIYIKTSAGWKRSALSTF